MKNFIEIGTIFSIIICFTYVIENVKAIRFMLPSNYVKCIREEVLKDVLIVGEINVVEHLVLEIDYVVTDSFDNILSKKDNIKGLVKFSAVMETNEMVEVCFKARPLMVAKDREFMTEISLVLTKDEGPQRLNGTAEVENLKPIEIKFKKIEQLSKSILNDFGVLLENEQLNRNTNESTHFRVFYFSVVSIAVLLALAMWQVLYLRRYFKVKKLIE